MKQIKTITPSPLNEKVRVKKIRKPKKSRLALYLRLGSIMLMLLALFMGFYGVCKWFDANKVVFKSPIVIKLQAPITVEKRNPVIIKKKARKVSVIKEVKAEALTEYDIVMKQAHGEVLWDIYMLESTRGIADHCRVSGEGWGGFGVMVDGDVYCYPTFEKAVERAEHWFSLLQPDKSLVGALCAWNLGTKGLVNCDYYQKYLSLQ
jgi:hypothetical protein